MQLKDFHEQLRDLSLYEKRTADDNLIDVVFETKDASAWLERLEMLLGAALKPAGSRPSGQANKIAKPFGGIRAEQTLFCKAFGEYSLVAMLWPWQNGKCTTCKIFPLPSETLADKPSYLSRLFKKE